MRKLAILISQLTRVVLRSVTEPSDTATPMGPMIFAIPGELCCRRALGHYR